MEDDHSVLFSPEAESESIKAYSWYKEIRPELGNDFQESLLTKIKSIKQNPNYSSFTYKNVRSSRLKKFPYSIIYRISNRQIQVIAVFHHSRNPHEWKTRV